MCGAIHVHRRQAAGFQEDMLTRKESEMGETKAKKKATKKPTWSHPSNYRGPRCGQLMRADGTRDGGRLKRWVCPAPICRKRVETVGERI